MVGTRLGFWVGIVGKVRPLLTLLTNIVDKLAGVIFSGGVGVCLHIVDISG